MVLLKVNLSQPSIAVLQRAASVLHRGGVIVYPTDTAYALGGIFNRPRVVRRVLTVKNRRDRKFTLVASSIAQVERFFRLSTAARRLAKQYWPGPLSIVVNKKYAVRVPDNKIARELARRVGAPLIATSANRSGGATPYSISAVMRQLEGQEKPDLILDAGHLKKQKPSTVIQVDGRGNITIVRVGSLKLKQSGPTS